MEAVKMDELKDKEAFISAQYIVIRLGDEKYGIDIRYVDNILRMQQITRVPKVAAYFRGVINLRGEVVPVMSVRVKMGLEDVEETKDTRIIILKADGIEKIGIIVDEVKEVVTLEEEQVDRMAYDSKEEKSAFVTAVGKCEEDLISLLDLHAVLAEQNL